MIHAITATWALNDAKKRETLSRRCPKCQNEQATPEEKINTAISCEKCGTEIPLNAVTIDEVEIFKKGSE